MDDHGVSLVQMGVMVGLVKNLVLDLDVHPEMNSDQIWNAEFVLRYFKCSFTLNMH